jgi:hypothetical protein
MLKIASICLTISIGVVMTLFAAFTEAKPRRETADRSLSQLYRLHRLPAIGRCYRSRIIRPTSRFGGMPNKDDGTVVVFANGLQQVSYEFVPQASRSRPGDKVTSCVFALPANCAAGDTRGIYYRTHNWRTHGTWTLPDSQHECGGA